MRIEPITLEGRAVRLEPLALEHLDGLCAVGLDFEVWRWSPQVLETRADMSHYVHTALRLRETGSALPFATIDRASGDVAGSTRFGNIDLDNLRAEIGWTWLGRRYWRSALNTEAKYLMLRHAFDVWGCNRVELKTDALNERSRAAIGRLGAVEEGVLRAHMVTSTGRLRDSVYYSILAPEWPAVRARLEEKMRLHRGAASGSS